MGLNIFGDLVAGVLGRILTGIIVGGGSELLHKIIEAAGDLATKRAAPYRQAGRAHKATAGAALKTAPALASPQQQVVLKVGAGSGGPALP